MCGYRFKEMLLGSSQTRVCSQGPDGRGAQEWGSASGLSPLESVRLVVHTPYLSVIGSGLQGERVLWGKGT